MELSGQVQDTSAKTPLPHAVTIVIKLKDSTLVRYTRSDAQGQFMIKNLPIDTYQVIISHPNFGDQTFLVVGSKENSIIDFKKIVLPAKNLELKQVTVLAFKTPVYFKGDTLVYVADSFKVKPNATVEDLLRKLPGIQVDAAGKITAQGQKVDKVLVDGDEFFGADPTVATRNLNASGLESVQVYEKKNDNPTADGANETLKILDLKLKEESKKGYFGKVSGASDFQKFYEAELLANKFSNKRKFSVFALQTNTPKMGFGWEDANKYGLDNENGFSYNEENDTWMGSNNNNESNGIPQTFKSGFYFSDKLFGKTKILLNYTYNITTISSTSETNTQTFLTDTSFTNKNKVESNKENQSHSVNLRIEHKIDSLTDLIIAPSFKLRESKENSLTKDDFLDEGNLLTRSTSISNLNASKNSDFTSLVQVKRKFRKKDRFLNMTYNFSLNSSSSDNLLDSRNTSYNLFSLSDTTRQKKPFATNNTGHSAAFVFVEPLSQKIKLEFSYDFSKNEGESHKKTLDFYNGDYTVENAIFSNNFNTSRFSQRVGLKYIYEIKKYKFATGLKARQVMVSNENTDKQQTISQTVNNLLPFLFLRLKFGDNKSMDFRYNTNSSQPELTQLQPIPDNNNPNQIKLGNPNLLPTFNNSFSLSYHSYKAITNQYFYMSLNFSFINSAFSNSTAIDSIGRTITQTINVDGNYNGNIYSSGSFPIGNIPLKLQPNISVNQYKNTNYINNQKNVTENIGVNPGVALEFTQEKFKLDLGGNMNYNQAQSTLNNDNNIPYFSYSLNADGEFQLPKKFFIQTDATYTNNQRRASGYNINYVIWNASFSKTFLKNENLILSVSTNDILNQNQNVDRTIEDNRIIDTKGNVVKRYFLFKVTWKFNSSKTKDEDEIF